MVLPLASGDSATAASRSFLFPCARLNPTECRDDVRSRASFPPVVSSMRETRINRVPLLTGKPKVDGSRDITDGNSRFFAAEELGIEELLITEIEGDLDEAGQLVVGVTTNLVRRDVPPEELGAKAERLMTLLNCTQEEVARLFHVSPSTLSRALACLVFPERHKEAASKLSPSARKLLAVIKDQAMLDQAMAFATKPRPDGSLPPYGDVALEVQRLKKAGKPGRKARPKEEVKPKDSPIASLTFYTDLDPKLLVRELKAITTLIETNIAYGPDAIAAILRSKSKFASAPPA